MISFFICLFLLIGGYFVYGKVVENTFAPDDRETPAVKDRRYCHYFISPLFSFKHALFYSFSAQCFILKNSWISTIFIN